MSNPAVSILTTVYNREQYVAECVESVLASTFTQFEYIIVDDCSTDRSYDIALEYAKRDLRITVYRNEENLGDYPSRNKAASYAKGEFLKYVDSDDVIYPHGLAMMTTSMRQFPSAVLGLCRPPDPQRSYPLQLSPREAYLEHFFGGGLLTNAPLSAIIRRDGFEQLGGFNELRYVGDTDMWLRLVAHRPVVKMVAGLTWWRSHSQQEYVEGHSKGAYLEWNYRIAARALDSANCPLEAGERVKALSKVWRETVRALLRLATKELQPMDAFAIWQRLSRT